MERKRTMWLAILLGVLVLMLIAGSYFFSNYRDSTSTNDTMVPDQSSDTNLQATISPTPILLTPTPTNFSISTLPAPLHDVNFPTEMVDYPPNWPNDLMFPDEFMLVETTALYSPGHEESDGWAAKLRYAGKIQAATESLYTFFTRYGWGVYREMNLDSGGVLIIIEKDNREKTGTLIFDSDKNDSESVIILVSIYY